MQLIEENSAALESYLKSQYCIFKYSAVHYLNEHDQTFINSYYFFKHIMDTNASVQERSRKIQQLTLNNDQNLNLISHGILYSILYNRDNESELFQYLKIMRQQAIQEFINKLIWMQQFEFDDLKDNAVFSLGVILESLLRYKEMFRLDEVFFYYLKNIIQGDFSERNLTYFSKIMTLLHTNITSIKSLQTINILVFFKSIKLLHLFNYVEDPSLAEYKKFMVTVIQSIWNHDRQACLSLGRDLVRLLSDSHQDDLAFISNDLKAVQQNGEMMIDSLFRNTHAKKELKYYVYSVLIPCKLEYMLDTMMKHNEWNSNEYRLKWIAKQYEESTIQLLLADIIRFLVQVYPTVNAMSVDSKPQIFLWALKNTDDLDLVKSHIKEAIFHDWLFFQDGHDFNPIAPGLQFINILKDPTMLQELLEFILVYAQKFNPSHTQKFRGSIRRCLILGQQERILKIDEIMARVFLPDLRKDIRLLLDNQAYVEPNAVYDVKTSSATPVITKPLSGASALAASGASNKKPFFEESPSSLTEAGLYSFQEEEMDMEDVNYDPALSMDPTNGNDWTGKGQNNNSNTANEDDDDFSDFYDPSNVHLDVPSTDQSGSSYRSSAKKSAKGVAPAANDDHDDNRAGSDSESMSNELYCDDAVKQNAEQMSNNQSQKTKEDVDDEEEMGEEEPVYEEIEEVEVLITEEAEMFLNSVLYTQFSEEIEALAANPQRDTFRKFVVEFIRGVAVDTTSTMPPQPELMNSAALFIYNCFQSHFDDFLLYENICMELIVIIGEISRKGQDVEYRIGLSLFSELYKINSNLLSFLLIHLAGQQILKDKQIILSSFKKIYLTLLQQETQSPSAVRLDIEEEMSKLYLIGGPQPFNSLMKELIANSYDVVFTRFGFFKSICTFCSYNYVQSDLVPLISQLKILSLTSDIRTILLKTYQMEEYEQNSFWKIYEAYLLANLKKPLNIDNLIKEILFFISDISVQINNNYPYWFNLSHFFATLIKQNKDAPLNNLFMMSLAQAEKFGVLLKAVDQQSLYLLFKRHFNSESFNSRGLPQFIQNCEVWKKFGIKLNSPGLKEFFEPKIYNKIFDMLSVSRLVKQCHYNPQLWNDIQKKQDLKPLQAQLASLQIIPTLY